MANNQQLQADLVVQLVGIMADEDKATLVAMLKKNGSLITENNTKSQILDATFKAIRDSANFRSDLENYLADKTSELSFANAGGEGWKKIKDVFGQILSKENIGALTGAGIGYLGASLQAKATRGQGQQAIDYTNAQASLADKQAQLLLLQQGLVGSSASQGGGNTPPPSTRPKWVVPVAIGGGLLVVGLIIYFATKKK